MLAPGFLLFPGLFHKGDLLVALALEGVEIAPVEGQLPVLQVQDRIDCLVEQVPVMADDENRAGIARDEVLEP